MLKVGIPEDAVRHKLAMEGVTLHGNGEGAPPQESRVSGLCLHGSACSGERGRRGIVRHRRDVRRWGCRPCRQRQ
jgi:hypothetical protein